MNPMALLDAQPRVGDALPQIAQVAPAAHIFVQLADPWLERLVSRLGRDRHLTVDGNALPADGAGV